MDKALKFLVAVACLCVIGVTAHYAYGSYTQAQETARRQARAVEAAKARIEAKAELEKARIEEAKDALAVECSKRFPSQSTDTLKQLHKNCMSENAVLYGLTPPDK